MGSVLAKTKHYLKEYIIGVRWMRLAILPALAALIVANYLEVQSSKYSASITSPNKKSGGTGYSYLQLYVVFSVLAWTLKYMVNLFNVSIIASSMRSGLKNFFHEYLTIKYASFKKIGVGEAQYSIVRRASALSDFLTTLSMYFISNLFFFMIAIFSINSNIPLKIQAVIMCSIVVFLGLSVLIQYFRAKLRRKVNDGIQENSRKLYDILLNYERIVAYDNIDVECNKYWDSMGNQSYYGAIYWVSYEFVGFQNALFFIIFNFYLISQFNLIPTIDAESLKGFIMLVTKLKEKVTDISRNIDEVCTSFTNLDQSMIEHCPKDEQAGLMHVDTFVDQISAQGLSFSFDDKPLLKDVSFAVKRGEKIAITGVNGTGKSTFIKILLGLYDYDGSLSLDKIEYRDLARKAIRGLISYVPQNSCLFDGTVMENLCKGNEGVSYSKIVEHCKAYDTHQTFKSIGYDAAVGERGKNLSGGQAQKVSFMRAVIKNAPIFILDEATSNMDATSELQLIRNIMEKMPSKTVFMIIHNLSLLENFDRVFFFDNSTLEAQGAFQEIYEGNERFKAFYTKSISEEVK